jgi:hypothetical protein
MQLMPQNTKEQPAGDGMQLVTSDRARLMYEFNHGDHVTHHIVLRALYRGDRIEIIWFDTLEFDYFIPIKELEALCAVPSPDQNKSPKMVKNSKNAKNAKNGGTAAASTFDRRNLPGLPVNDHGLTSRVFAWLEVCRFNSHSKCCTKINIDDRDDEPDARTHRLCQGESQLHHL